MINFTPISFKSRIVLDASEINKDDKQEMKKAIELAEEKHDQTVLSYLKNTLNDGKDDTYHLVYSHKPYGMCSFPAVYLFKNKMLIANKSTNCDHGELTNEIWREQAYNNLSNAEKEALKADIEKVKSQLTNSDDMDNEKKFLEFYPNLFNKQINYSQIKDYQGSYKKSEGLSLDPGYLNEDMGLFKSGGYIIAPIGTPISTVGMYECAAVYIPDKNSGKHFLWHVGKNTSVDKIAENIKKNNLQADEIWIAQGCTDETFATIDKIQAAVISINPNAKFAIIEPSRDEQEVIGYEGELFGSYKTTKVSFETPQTEFCE